MSKRPIFENDSRKSFHDFVELRPELQAEVLRSEAQLLDTEIEGNSLVKLYYLAGFFVEEILNKTTLELQFILPFKRGFRLNNYRNTQAGVDLGKTYLRNYPYHN